MWVVKLGGSLAQADELPLWLDVLRQTRTVIVPGGGPFADVVRTTQARWSYADSAAHHMSILAMRQFGMMLAAMCPDLQTSAHPQFIRKRATIWLPDPAILDSAGIPHGWDITSDSLAAWLTRQLDARQLLLIKSLPLGPRPVPLAEVSTNQAVDDQFHQYAQDVSVWICARQAYSSVLSQCRSFPGLC